MSAFSVYHQDQVRALLDYPGCIEAMRRTMADFSREGCDQPLRTIIPVGSDEKLFALMPGIASSEVGFGAKIISVFEDAETPGRSSHEGVVSLFDSENGALLSIADAHEVTKIRTACASAVATDVLSRPDSRVLTVFGTGTQAESHIKALSLVRPFERVLVWGRSRKTGEAFVSRMCEETGLPVYFTADPAEAAGQADVICTVTNSATPVLFHAWVKPGTHINAVGSSFDGPVEVDNALVVESRYIVDSRRSALVAASEFLAARKAGLIDESHIVAEIGEVILNKKTGRENPNQITFYKSLGHIVQDLAAVAYIHARTGGSEGGIIK
ncbi:MAG: ornithine cyclodeaminase family protein [Emcibacter sp.]|nr:ornithine cyclodeaminase family protein [Emcibacter sp.]